MVVFDSFDDNEMAVPPLTTKTPLRATRAGAETREMRRAREAAGQVPKPARMTPPARVEAASPRTVGAPVGPSARQGGSGRSHRFRIAWRES